MTPRALRLDFLARRNSRRWLEFGLLALVLAGGAQLLATLVNTRDRIDQLETRKHGGPRAERDRIVVSSLSESTLREADRINVIIDELTVPWDKLFRAVETTPRERIALLSLTPDQRAGTVQVAGEAADPGAMFDYVDRLQKQPTLTDVFLLTQKFDEHDLQRTIRFTVTASWLEHDFK